MKSLLVAVVISLIASSSALAFSKREASSQGMKIRDSKAMAGQADDHNVYANGRIIGRDPDPAIRERLRTENYLIRGY
jgi:hypothetical protein